MHPDYTPEMRTGILNDEGVEALFRDIQALATVDEIIMKEGPGRVGEPEDAPPLTLDEARERLLARDVRGVQIRYRHEGACWWDTLMCDAQGVRLVRVRHEFGQ